MPGLLYVLSTLIWIELIIKRKKNIQPTGRRGKFDGNIHLLTGSIKGPGEVIENSLSRLDLKPKFYRPGVTGNTLALVYEFQSFCRALRYAGADHFGLKRQWRIQNRCHWIDRNTVWTKFPSYCTSIVFT